MPSKTFKVPNISCGHCVRTVENELSELEGIKSVAATEKSQMVTVDWEEPTVTWPEIKELLEEINYPPAE